MTSVQVDSGICGYVSTVRATRSSASTVHIELESECSMIMKCAESLSDLKLKDALNPRSDGWIHNLMFRHIRHCGCLVPAGVAKAIEVEVGAALPASAHMEFAQSRDA